MKFGKIVVIAVKFIYYFLHGIGIQPFIDAWKKAKE